MKIKTKISIGFTIMISIFAVFSILAFQNEQQVQELSLKTIDYTIPQIAVLNQIKSSAELIPFLISEIATPSANEASLGDITEGNPTLIQLNNEIAKFDDTLFTYQSLIINEPEESVFVYSIKEKWENLVSIIDEYTQSGEMETDKIKIRELHRELEITQRELLTAINLALDFEWGEIDKRKEITQASFDANFQFLAGGLVIVIILSVIIVLIISKSVSTTVKDLEAILTGTKSSLVGKKSDRIVHEIADLSKPIQSLSDDVKKYRGRLDSIEKFENLNEFQKITYKINLTLNRIKNKPLKLEDVLVSDILDYALLDVTIPEDHTFEDLGNNVKIHCDSNTIKSVFSSLILNSISSNGKKGAISFEATDKGDRVTIKVQTNVLELPEDVLPKIFNSSLDLQIEEPLLGLRYCKTIIERHGGQISLKNDPSTFTIEIPKILHD